MSSFEKDIQEKMYETLSATGFVDKDVFYEEIRNYTNHLLKQSDFDKLLLNLGECLIEVGGDPQIICSYDYLNETTALDLLNTLAPNRIKFCVVEKQDD